MSNRRLEGIIELPRSLLVDATVLGERLSFRVADGEVELWFQALPSDAATAEWHVLVSPLRDAPRLDGITDDGWGRAGFGKHPEHQRPLASWVDKVAFRASVDAEASRAPRDYAYDFASQLYPWLEAVDQWIDLWAPGALSLGAVSLGGRTSGHLWDSSTDPDQLTGWGPGVAVGIVGSSAAVNRLILESAMAPA